MAKLILILGGARSGKSTYAAQLASSCKKVAYIATARRDDDPEMKERIKEHQRIRPAGWLTVEEPLAVDKSLAGMEKKVEAVIVDCITLLITNWLLKGVNGKMDVKKYRARESVILNMIKRLVLAAKKTKPTVIIVSNEVGLGIHPENRLGRYFRDIAGWSNRILAEAADEIYLMAAGIPLKIKG
ncbi:MAG: adenosylcobinamide kinase / adenosylcobinamide-phosphate guanylyltransferase [Candidatus Saganbacteria bacterium]|uniref:Adenosylcobinamide kinase n=1 Tax=Candidatus Saganbacteria bacterium TaxID=2575572 RepID=A0A833L289_UNCSA|nr:MAG: adenosylcobinamide kinase / adenosylcobinamide-phosphate guanylyltransferase [Candidatus Saganbacteria bacterium]